MYRILFLFILIIPFLACNSENEGQSNSATSSPLDLSMERPKIASLTFQTFDSIPNEIDGCACYFYLSEKDETSAKHLLVNDFASIAFMKIEGEMKKFELETFENEMRIYRDTQGIYRLYISVEKKVELDEETSRLEGKLHLTKGSEKAITNFIGFCGC